MTIEQRVDRLEGDAQANRHLTKVRLDAVGDAVNRTHADLLAFREETAGSFVEVKAEIADVKAEIADIKGALAEILDRLPPRDQA